MYLLTATLTALMSTLCKSLLILSKPISFRIVACTVITRYISLDLHCLIIYMKKSRNSVGLRAVRLIPSSAILSYQVSNFCYSVQISVIAVQIYNIIFWREKQIWRLRLDKLSEHFVKIWSEFCFDTASKIFVN